MILKYLYVIFFLITHPKIIFFFIYFYAKSRKAKYFFFFPRMGLGGADKMQIHLCNSLQDNIILIFDKANKKDICYLDRLNQNINFFCIYQYIENDIYRLILTKIIIYLLKNKEKIIFGANSTYFYNLLPHIPKHTICGDRVPALGGGIEIYASKVKDRLNIRFLTYNKMKNDAYIKTTNNAQKQIVLYAQTSWKIEKKIKNINNKIKVIYTGRNSSEKRIHLIQIIADKVFEKKLNIQFELIGDMPQEYQTKNIKITSTISNESELMKKVKEADVFLLLSEREGIPISIIEASTKGIVPICTNVGGISEKFIDKKNAFLIDNSLTEDEMIHEVISILEYIDKNRNFLATMSSQVIELAESEFIHIDNMKKIFKQNLQPHFLVEN